MKACKKHGEKPGNFCDECGEELNMPTNRQLPIGNFYIVSTNDICPKLGCGVRLNHQHRKFCSNCGAEFLWLCCLKEDEQKRLIAEILENKSQVLNSKKVDELIKKMQEEERKKSSNLQEEKKRLIRELKNAEIKGDKALVVELMTKILPIDLETA